MPFVALDLSLSLIRSLAGLVAQLAARDPKLADQARRAASSVALNLGEGRRRFGRDRAHCWRIAAGSAEELRTALHVAEAWGHLDPADIASPLAQLDRLLAMLWRLTQR